MDLLRGWRNHSLVWRLPPDLLRRTEIQTGLPPHLLDQAMLDPFDTLDWKPTVGSRYCVTCLAQSGGQWPIRWQLPYTFACTIHRCLLAAVCPLCAQTPHSSWSGQSGLLPSHHCTIRPRKHAEICGADLLTHPVTRLRPDDPRLAAQHWIDHRLSVMDENASVDLRDLAVLATWFRARIEPGDLRHLGKSTMDAVADFRDPQHPLGNRRQQPIACLVTAAIATQAVGLLTAADRTSRYLRFAPLFRDYGLTLKLIADWPKRQRQPTTAPALPAAPKMLSHKRIRRLSEPLQRQLLSCCDPHLPITERLRYRTSTSAPCLPEPGSTIGVERARYIPQYLWHEWIIRLRPLRGTHVDDMAIDIPTALMIPGNPVRNIHTTDELNPWRHNVGQTLLKLAENQTDTLAVLCALAQYLDTNGAPIDYRRRRARFTDVPLTKDEWLTLCTAARSHQGRAGALLNARRFMFQLLTGADLNNTKHILAFGNPKLVNDSAEKSQKASYLGFIRRMSTPLEEASRKHARQLLYLAGIDEPLTWSPPADCVAGLTLPGREPDDIDLQAVHRLLVVEKQSMRATARQLGVCLEHIRYAQQQLYRPPREYPKHSPPAARERRKTAADILTVEFFQREHIDAGKDLETLVAETGYSRKYIYRYARQAGVKIVSPHRKTRIKVERARRGDRIDRQWLTEQAGTNLRTNDDIATELGLRGETIRRYRADYGLPGRPRGGHGHVVTYLQHPQLPDDIRRAVEGQRNGWQRLQRFQQMMAYPSINSAAIEMDLHTQNLTLQIQRLEADIGTQLLDRAPHRYAPMGLTNRGRRLLTDLHQPEVCALLNRYASANERPKCGPYKTKPGPFASQA